MSTDNDDEIPTCGHHRGVPLHADQPMERLERVKREIDLVFMMEDVRELFEFAASVMNAPEARLLAASRIEAIWESRDHTREARPPGITSEMLRASVAGLASARWRDPHYYCSGLDAPAFGRPGSPKPPRRHRPLW